MKCYFSCKRNPEFLLDYCRYTRKMCWMYCFTVLQTTRTQQCQMVGVYSQKIIHIKNIYNGTLIMLMRSLNLEICQPPITCQQWIIPEKKNQKNQEIAYTFLELWTDFWLDGNSSNVKSCAKERCKKAIYVITEKHIYIVILYYILIY